MKLELYYFPACPYCRRVLNYLEESGRSDVVLADAKNDQAAAEYLKEKGGKYQVPCLFIDGKPMYESLDIIDWLKANP